MGPMGRVLPILLLATTSAACGVGDDGPGVEPTPEPRICTTVLAITGTFTQSLAVPDDVNNDTQLPPGDGLPDFTGCWPVGTWTFSLALGENTCDTPPTPEASYSFRTDYVPDMNGEPQYEYALLAPTPMNYRLKVSSGGGGLCEGLIELYSDDALESWILHPALNTFNMNGPLGGEGEYAIWREPAYP